MSDLGLKIVDTCIVSLIVFGTITLIVEGVRLFL